MLLSSLCAIPSQLSLTNLNVLNVKVYNNTIYLSADSPYPYTTSSWTNASTYGVFVNNAVQDAVEANNNRSIYSVDVDSQTGFSGHHNLVYNTSCGGACTWGDPFNTETGKVANSDPLFITPTNHVFEIPTNSPAKDAGGSLTLVATADTGAGTSLILDDASMFQGGWGITGVSDDWVVPSG